MTSRDETVTLKTHLVTLEQGGRGCQGGRAHGVLLPVVLLVLLAVGQGETGHSDSDEQYFPGEDHFGRN